MGRGIYQKTEVDVKWSCQLQQVAFMYYKKKIEEKERGGEQRLQRNLRCVHCKKKVIDFLVPSRDVTHQTHPDQIIPGQGEFGK